MRKMFIFFALFCLGLNCFAGMIKVTHIECQCPADYTGHLLGEVTQFDQCPYSDGTRRSKKYRQQSMFDSFYTEVLPGIFVANRKIIFTPAGAPEKPKHARSFYDFKNNETTNPNEYSPPYLYDGGECYSFFIIKE